MFKFLGSKLRSLFKGKVDENMLEELEELFYQADLGPTTSAELTELVRKLYKRGSTSEEILEQLKKTLIEQLEAIPSPPQSDATPQIILIVGVNGNGKTTTVAKLAHFYQNQGKKVLIAAADTFRAAAIEQLEKWATQSGCTLVKGKHGSDAAAVVFDAVEAAKSRNIDVVLVDTAGRLHTKTDLMHELEKIRRVCAKAQSDSPHETLLVLDATIGQNGVEQAVMFHKFTPLSGLVLTKLDGSAKGGTAIALQQKLEIPVKYVGTGETIEAFAPFDPRKFVDELFR